MNIRELAFMFIGMLTDERRLTIIRQLDRKPLNHAIFAHYLTEMGHPHDWTAYLHLMGAVQNKP